MKMTLNPPKGTGYFWWTNGGEHTPTILKVRRIRGRLCAENGEYAFPVSEKPVVVGQGDEYEERVFIHEEQEHYYGTELWSEQPIELPEINGEFVLPDSF